MRFTYKFLSIIAISINCFGGQVHQRAFPSAEGFGAFAKGGRGGSVIYVTNLNDSGPGSLRDAIDHKIPRNILFAVSGSITLKSDLIIKSPYITIAGQTAPGDGVTIKQGGIYIMTHDVILRHIRIRPGDLEGKPNPDDRDGITIGQEANNVIVDHVSVSWAIDENISTWYEPKNITIQWNLISEALNYSKHPKGKHSMGLLIGDNSKQVSVHHNLFAHNNARSPATVKGGATCDIVNNLVYNWGDRGFAFSINYTQKPVYVNLIGNIFLRGPSSRGHFFKADKKPLESVIYLSKNTGDDPYLIKINEDLREAPYLSKLPHIKVNNIKQTTNEAKLKNLILADAGATLPKRDDIDKRIVSDVINRSGQIIDSQREVGGWIDFNSREMSSETLRKRDTDLDGIPNYWEKKYGLNQHDPKDGKEFTNSGYTNLEIYLNQVKKEDWDLTLNLGR